MFSLIITVESIRLVANLAYATTARQYANETETHLKQDEGYCIPSLIWPPPAYTSSFKFIYHLTFPHYPPIHSPRCLQQLRGDSTWRPQ